MKMNPADKKILTLEIVYSILMVFIFLFEAFLCIITLFTYMIVMSFFKKKLLAERLNGWYLTQYLEIKSKDTSDPETMDAINKMKDAARESESVNKSLKDSGINLKL